jgi:hypothetical protein
LKRIQTKHRPQSGINMRYTGSTNSFDWVFLNAGVRTNVLSATLGVPNVFAVTGNLTASGTLNVTGAATFGASSSVTGAFTASTFLSAGSGAGLHVVSGGETVFQGFHAIQIRGSTSSVPSGFTAANVGISATAYNVVIPMVTTESSSATGLAILGASGISQETTLK